MPNKTLLITGGAGFIGSAAIRHIIQNTGSRVVNVDKLTYAGNLDSLGAALNSERYAFEQIDICQHSELQGVLARHQPAGILHLAAESHVDRSIDNPAAFVKTNITGTYTLLEACLQYWQGLSPNKRSQFRFLHVSTDEVYGDLELDAPACKEAAPYSPNSPYAASKAASDHLVRSWVRTYGFPALISNCTNNYGPYQFPEKLIPLMILNALEGRPLPVYGQGRNVRDWLYVEDHVRALRLILEKGRPGETYHISGGCEKQNIEVVRSICNILNDIAPAAKLQVPVADFRELITFVPDRPGHDLRYALDSGKLKRELGWVQQETFETGLRKTVQWYLDHPDWCRRVQDGSYQRQRLGTRGADNP